MRWSNSQSAGMGYFRKLGLSVTLLISALALSAGAADEKWAAATSPAPADPSEKAWPATVEPAHGPVMEGHERATDAGAEPAKPTTSKKAGAGSTALKTEPDLAAVPLDGKAAVTQPSLKGAKPDLKQEPVPTPSKSDRGAAPAFSLGPVTEKYPPPPPAKTQVVPPPAKVAPQANPAAAPVAAPQPVSVPNPAKTEEAEPPGDAMVPQAGKNAVLNQKPVQSYCVNIANSAMDARYLRQKKQLEDLRADIQKKTGELEARIEDFKGWMVKRDEFASKARDSLVSIYASMKSESAAKQLAELDEETASSVLAKLDARQSSAIMSEMEPKKAASLIDIIARASKLSVKEPAEPVAGAASEPSPEPEGADLEAPEKSAQTDGAP